MHSSFRAPRARVGVLAGLVAAALCLGLVEAPAAGAEGGSPDMAISVVSLGSPSVSWEDFAYQVTTENVGTAAETGFVVVGIKPGIGQENWYAEGEGWECGLAEDPDVGPFIACGRDGPVAVDEVLPPISVRVLFTPASHPETAAVTVAVVDPDDDLNEENDGDVIYLDVPTFDLTGSITGALTSGGTGSYTFTMTNHGATQNWQPVTVKVLPPPGLTATSVVAGDGWGCGDPLGYCEYGFLLPGETSEPLTVNVDVDPGVGPNVTITAEILPFAGGEPYEEDNTVHADIPVAGYTPPPPPPAAGPAPAAPVAAAAGVALDRCAGKRGRALRRCRKRARARARRAKRKRSRRRARRRSRSARRR